MGVRIPPGMLTAKEKREMLSPKQAEILRLLLDAEGHVTALSSMLYSLRYDAALLYRAHLATAVNVDGNVTLVPSAEFIALTEHCRQQATSLSSQLRETAATALKEWNGEAA